ncbi:CRISPR-associated endonuclease Cas2, partial [Mangrovihabitans endophyticus]
MPTVLITYDITTDTTRAHAAALIQMWGNRIQRSVYLCHLDHDDLT